MQAPSSAEVSDALDRIFARPEFAEREAPLLLRMLGEAWQRFVGWLASLVPRIVPEQWSPLFTAILAGVGGLLAIWLLVRLIDRQRAGGATRVAAAADGEAEPASHDAGWWEQAARAAAEDGRYRDAALALYAAAVLRLEERGVVRFEAGKTPGDYRREARSDAGVRGVFDGFIRQFLPVAFGPAAPDAAAFSALRSRATELGVHA